MCLDRTAQRNFLSWNYCWRFFENVAHFGTVWPRGHATDFLPESLLRFFVCGDRDGGCEQQDSVRYFD
jgi:hypothetical protein